MIVTDTADISTDSALVEILQSVEVGDVLVVNGDTRTWDVTDAVERAIDDPTDARESKRVLRLNSRSSVFGLELVSYEDYMKRRCTPSSHRTGPKTGRNSMFPSSASSVSSPGWAGMRSGPSSVATTKSATAPLPSFPAMVSQASSKTVLMLGHASSLSIWS